VGGQEQTVGEQNLDGCVFLEHIGRIEQDVQHLYGV